MRRILFQWRGFQVYSYPVMLYIGLVCGIIAGNHAAVSLRLESARIYVATLLLLIPALVGARLLFVATHWDVYSRAPERIWRRSEGGGSLYGGLPFALLASIPLLGLLEVPLGAFWDVAALTILIGMIFTRFGCLLNGCCCGRVTDGPFGMYLPDHNGNWQRRIPTQIMEAGWATGLLLGAIALWNHTPFSGAIFLYVLIGYGTGRFLLEPMRKEQDKVGRIKLHRLVSAILVAGALFAFLLMRLR